MANRVKGHRDGGQSNNPRPQALDKQTSVEAVVVTTGTLMQAGVVAVIIV